MHLQLTNVSKFFTDRRGNVVPVVSGLTLEVGRGEFVCLLGPSGCGKTTVLRLAAGLESPTAGKILLGGRDITKLPPEKRNMSVVFQHYALFPHMSVAANIAFGLKVRRKPSEEISRKVHSLLDVVGLSGLGERAPSELSGGQQQRVALARALAIEPSVLLCDEPLSNLDSSLRLQMRTEIKALQHRLGLSTLYVTHDEEEAKFLADRIVRMEPTQ
ncbi:MAG: ABC transporter ATP-binding protein [Pseudomonadota bacterium]